MTATAVLPVPNYSHVERMTTSIGMFEHAEGDEPRREHGYCVDDVARALTVALAEPHPTPELAALPERYLAFLEDAIVGDGRVHNRMNVDGVWTDEPSIGDWWGRALGGLGFAAAYAPDPFLRTRALYAFLRAARWGSPDVRASAFAAIGAADVLRVHPDSVGARSLLTRCLTVLPRAPRRDWRWPEARLRYANAALCEALIAGGAALGRPEPVATGLGMLRFLLTVESAPGGHLSPTGSAGRSPGETGPLWDQQPIEPAALATACAAATDVEGGAEWRAGIERAWAWFAGDNDGACPSTTRPRGKLRRAHPPGRNDNRGAESTLAALRTLQVVRAARAAAAS